MAPIIIENKDRIVSACRNHKLKYLYVFGSAARGDDFRNNSDIDFLYAFDKDQIEFETYADNYFDFRFKLQELLNRNIDLLPEDLITNPYLLDTINQDKVKLYG